MDIPRAPEAGTPVVNAANQRADHAARRAQAREQFVEIGIAVMSEPNLPALAAIRELRQENERLKQLVAKLNLLLKAEASQNGTTASQSQTVTDTLQRLTALQ